jgi:hypothetical protein
MDQSARTHQGSASVRLGVDDAVTIRARFASGVSVRVLASEHGVSLASVYAVLRGHAHRCVVRVVLPDAVFASLSDTARCAGRPREELAAELLVRALAPPAGR